MNIVIVGHGSSLKKARLGEVIDKFDFVCKVKRGLSAEKAHLETPECAGYRCDAVASPLRVNFKGLDVKGAREFWPVRLVKHRGGTWGTPFKWWEDLKELQSHTNMHIVESYEALCFWGRKFTRMKPLCGPSSGLEAITIALDYYKPKELALAGFDAMKTGKISEWSKKLGKDPHPAWIERVMLGEMSKHYNVKVRFL